MNKLCIIGNPNIVHVKRWATDFSTLGWDVHLIGEHKLSTNLPGDCTFYDLPQIINLRKIRYVLWLFLVKGFLNKVQPDILHTLGVTSAGWLGATSNFHPFICTSLGSDLLLLEKRSFLHQQFSHYTIKNVDKLICVSEPLNLKATRLGVPDKKRETINLGVNTTVFKPAFDKNLIRRKLNLPDHLLVLNIRAIQPLYQPIKFALAIPEVLKIIPDLSFIIFTYNADRLLLENIKRLLSDFSVLNHVVFVPPIFNDEILANYYQAADVVVSIPTSDGMPASVMESMACGAAVIATDLPNLYGWLQNNREGVLIPVDNDIALKSALIQVLSDHSLRSGLQQRAVESIKFRADRTKILQRILDIYTEQMDMKKAMKYKEQL